MIATLRSKVTRSAIGAGTSVGDVKETAPAMSKAIWPSGDVTVPSLW